MLRRKYTVQKSIRFDQKLADDLTYLANELDRSLNDVVNIACEDLIHENKGYFKQLFIVDNLFEFFEGDAETSEFQTENLKIKVWSDAEKENVSIIYLDNDKKIIDRIDKSFDDIDELHEFLTQFTFKDIDLNSQLVEDYLKHRLDYK